MTTKIDLDNLERKATAARGDGADWRTYRCRSASPSEACGVKSKPFVSEDEDACQNGVVYDTSRDECQHHMLRVDAEHIAANSPPVTLALLEIAKALRDFTAVHDELDRIDPDGKIDPQSDEAVEWGQRSIDAWKRVEEALKAVRA